MFFSQIYRHYYMLKLYILDFCLAGMNMVRNNLNIFD